MMKPSENPWHCILVNFSSYRTEVMFLLPSANQRLEMLKIFYLPRRPSAAGLDAAVISRYCIYMTGIPGLRIITYTIDRT